MKKNQKIFVSTLFKSGTKLIESLIEQISGLKAHIVPMSTPPIYGSADPIIFEDNKFFIYHNILSDDVIQRIKKENAKVILLTRNIFDLVVAQYFHFVNDVDAEIGHATKSDQFLKKFEKSDVLTMIINGIYSNKFTYPGIKDSIIQIESFINYKKNNECLIIDFEEMVYKKESTILQIANFIGEKSDKRAVDEMIKTTSLETMRLVRKKMFGSGAHFKSGESGKHKDHLSVSHYLNILSILSRDFPGLIQESIKLNLGRIFETRNDYVNKLVSN